MRKEYFLLMSVYCLLNISTFVFGQNNNIKPLRVGDTIPDLVLGEILNHPNLKSAKLSDFKGKLLILDFWATYCGSCIQGLPKMFDIQQEFKDQITILPIAVDGEQARSLIAKWRGTPKELKLPTILVEDYKSADLFKYLPPAGLPHEVWVSPDGIIIATTGAAAVNSKNIQEILNGKTLPFREKRLVKLLHPDQFKPLYLKGLKNERVYGSAFAAYTDSVATTQNEKRDSLNVHFLHINSTKIYLYTYAYNHLLPKISKKLTFFNNIRNPLLLEGLKYQGMDNFERYEFDDKFRFCYELILPNTYSDQDAYNWMIEDLNRFFKMESRVEIRKVRCLSLIRTSRNNNIKSKEAANGLSNIKADYKKATILYQNYSMDFLVQLLEAKFKLEDLIINETNYPNKFDFILPEKMTSISELKSLLKKYDLDLVEVERELPVLILNDKK